MMIRVLRGAFEGVEISAGFAINRVPGGEEGILMFGPCGDSW